jgi:hypothetical protein
VKARDIVLVAIVGSAAGVATVEVTRSALAAGTPVVTPLIYSGRLTEAGAAVTGDRPISVFLWDDATSTDAVHRRCATIPAAPLVVRDGRFDIALDPTCRPVVESTGELWVEVQVSGTSMGRTKIGAVPYALEAQRAVSVERPVYVNKATGGQWSLNAGYCGATAATTGAFRSGSLTGWKAAKGLCEATCASPSAHMCTGEELVRYNQTGGDIPTIASTYGWYSSGLHNHYTSTNTNECYGFTFGGGNGNLGSVWKTDDEVPLIGYCNGSYSILCCD